MAAGRGSTGRLLGLGFLFGGKDDGAVKTATDVSEGMDKLADATERAGKRSEGLAKFGNIINGLNFLQLDRIGDAMEGLAQKAGIGPGGAANSIESFGVQFNQSFKQATAGLGKYAGAVKKHRGEISSNAFNLGVDAGELTGTVAQLVRTGHAVRDYGLDVRSIAGSMQAGILSGEQLGQVLTDLSESYDMGAKGAASHLDKITALGEMFGVGKEAVQGLEGALAAADPVLSKFSNLKVDNVTESITRLALAGQQRLGGKFQDRMQDAIGVFNELAGAREQMGELITGLGSDFPELAKEIGIASGDVGQSMEQILSDPLSFAKNMQKLMSSMDQGDIRFQRLKLSLGKLPAGFNYLIQGGEASAKALDAASQPVKNFEGAFKKMAKGASGSARTFQEQMDLLEEQYEARLNKMTSQTDAQVVKRQGKAWKKLGDLVDRMRGKDSPLGKTGAFMLQTMLDVRRHGLVNGLIPAFEKLSKSGGPVGSAAKKMQEWLPLMDGMGEGFIEGVLGAGKLAIGLSMLRGPIGGLINVGKSAMGMIGGLSLPVIALAAAGYLVYKNWDLIQPTLQAVWDVLSTELAPAFEEVRGVASELWTNVKAGSQIIWEQMKDFGRWFMKNLPAMMAAGANSIVKAVAYVRYGIQRAWVFGKYAFKNLTLHAEMLGASIDLAIGGALDMVRKGWDGFLTTAVDGMDSLKLAMISIPLQVSKFMKSMLDVLPKKIRDSLGLDVVSNGIDDTIKYWTKSYDDAFSDIAANERDHDKLLASMDEQRLRREARMSAATSALTRSRAEEDAELLDIEMKRDRLLNKADKMGANLQDRLTAAIAARDAGDEETVAPKKAARKKRGPRTNAQVQSDRIALATPAAAGGGPNMGIRGDLAPFLKGFEEAVARGTERGAARGTEQGVKKGTKKVGMRPAEAGGADRT